MTLLETSSNSLPLIMMGVGFASLAGAVLLAIRNRRLARNGTAATGVITRIEERRESGNQGAVATAYYPEFRFETPDGQSHTILAKVGRQSAGFKVGQSVPVLYEAERPEKARINTFGQMWAVVIMFSLIGVILFGVGFVISRM